MCVCVYESVAMMMMNDEMGYEAGWVGFHVLNFKWYEN